MKRIDGIYLQIKTTIVKPEVKQRIKWAAVFVLIVNLLFGVYAFYFVSKPQKTKAAEVPIDATTVSATILSHQKSGKNIVCKSDTYCYAFYIDVNNDLAYKKSTDGGDNWDASATVLDAGTWVASGVWYDKWTPGDSGTYVHIAYFSTADDIMYERFQTTDNTHLSTEVTIASTGAQGSLTTANDVAVSKGTDGNLYAATVDATAPTAPANFTHKCPVSSDCTLNASWASAGANPWDGVGQDAVDNHSLIILPLPDDASHDLGDMMLVSFDVGTAANGIEYKVYDDSANSWSTNFTTILAATDSTTYTHTLSGTVNPTTGALYISWVNVAGTISTSVVNSYKYSGGSWSALTSPRTAATNYYVTESSIGIDSSTNDLYVVYSRGLSATANDVFYSKSINDGSSWSMENLLSSGTDRNHRAISIDNYNASRLYAVWHDLTNFDLYGNSVVVPVTTITVSGGCFTDANEGTGCTDGGAGDMIKVAVNGTPDAGSDGTVDGSWQFTIPQPAGGAILTFYRDGAPTNAERATTVVKYDGDGGNVTLVKMYQSILVIGADATSANSDQTIINSDLDTTGNGFEYSDDNDSIYGVNTGVLTVDEGAVLTETLYVISGDIYRPDSAGGDTVTTHHLYFEGTYTTDNNVTNVAGDWTNAGTFTATTGTVTLNGSGGSSQIVGGTSNTTFYNLYATAATARTINFASGSTTTVSNLWTATGSAGQNLSLGRSGGSGSTQWNINPNTWAVNYVTPSNSNNQAASPINPANYTDGGNNTNWFVTNLNPDTPTNLGPAGYIDAAGWMNDNTPTVNFDITDPDPAEQVKYRIQIDDTAGFGSVVLDYQPSSFGAEGTYNYTVGQAGSYAVGSPGMTLSDSAAGGGYYWRVKAIDDDLAESAYEEAGVDGTIDFRIDATAPSGLVVYDGTVIGVDQDYSGTSLNSLAANWTAANFNTSGPATPNKYQYAIGTTAGGTEILTWTFTNTDVVVVTANSLSVDTATMYFWTVKATDLAGNITTVSSNGQIVQPTISFSFDTPTVTFTNLGNPDWTDTKTTDITTQTNAKTGYNVQAYALQLLTQLTPPYDTISDWTGTYSTPAPWAGNCVSNSQCGFGYTSSDPNITTESRGNMYNSGANYCAYSQTAPGDVVADNNGPTIDGSRVLIDQVFTLTHKVSVSQSQTAGQYQTTLMLLVTANY